MDPTSYEDLSALMDGELGAEPARFLLRRMEHEPELARAWSRWHLIRACMADAQDSEHADPVRRATADCNADDVFATRVMQAVHAQPAVVRRHWARYLGGGAIAASVAAAALMLAVPQTASIDTSAPVAVASDHAGVVTPRVATATAAPRTNAPLPWLDRQPMFLAANPAAANTALGGGLLQSNYLQQAAYAPDADHQVMLRGTGRTAGAPYMILLVPDHAVASPTPH